MNSSLIEQTSILFYSLIKNHPFRNGNKRIAVIAILVFLRLNNKWLKIPPLSLYKIAVIVAKSDPKQREIILNESDKIFEKYMMDLKV